MSKEKTSLEEIREWLVQGVDNPDTFVDLRWQVLEERKEDGKLVLLRVTHPRMPVNLIIQDLEREDSRIKMVRLAIETGIETVDLDASRKLKLYRGLLIASKIPLAKFILAGDTHEIEIVADLDKRLLTKDEFEEALAALFTAYTYLTSVEEFKDELIEKGLTVLLELVSNWHSKGRNRDEALKSLVKAGIDIQLAEKIVDMVYPKEAKEGSKLMYT